MLQNRLAQLREERAQGDRGFTLIELLVVVVIIGVLIAIAIPLYLNYTKSSKDTSSQSDVRNAISTLETCNSDNGSYPLGAATTITATAAVGTCTQKVVVSNNSTLVYNSASATDSSAYSIVGYNSGGNTKKYYCYSSAAGGSVVGRTATGTVPTTYQATC